MEEDDQMKNSFYLKPLGRTETNSRFLNACLERLLVDIIQQSGAGPVAHTCNLSYQGGRDWDYQGSRPAWAK
jgi:hypothetical protein